MNEGGQTYVVKNGRHRHAEPFDREKLYKSLIAACLSSSAPAGHADSMANRVADEVIAWLEGRPEVTTNDLRRVASKYLRTYHPDASYLYEHHRSTL